MAWEMLAQAIKALELLCEQFLGQKELCYSHGHSHPRGSSLDPRK